MTIDFSRATWRKSTRSGANNDCVEVAGNLPGTVAVRDSKDRDGRVLVFRPGAWDAFVTGLKGSGSGIR